MDASETAVVYTTNDFYEAEIIKNALNDEGIVCELDGGSQGGFVELVEIKLMVRASDAERARSVIEQHQAAADRDAALSDDTEIDDIEDMDDVRDAE